MSLKKSGELYFVALVPPEPILDKVETLKQQLSRDFNTKGALRSPAHITLHMPFSFPETREEEIFEALNQVKLSTNFDVEVSGFGSFPKRVIYIDVFENQELSSLHNIVLRILRKKLNVIKDTPHNRGFVPHMTVAFRDLKPAMFEEAWSSLHDQPISFSWNCESFALLKHNGKNWEILKEFSIT